MQAPISFPESAFDQWPGNATALGDSKTGTSNFWFRFDSARASKIVVEINKFQQPMRFGRLFGGLSVLPRGLDSWRRPEGSRPFFPVFFVPKVSVFPNYIKSPRLFTIKNNQNSRKFSAGTGANGTSVGNYKSLYLSVNVFSTAVLIEDTVK